jgi:hypothetical protein
MQERRHISVRALLPLVPPDPIPPTRAVPGAPLSVTRDTRKGRDARAAPQTFDYVSRSCGSTLLFKFKFKFELLH